MKKTGVRVLGAVLVLGLVIGLGSYSCAREEGLVGYWKFDEGRGNIAKDSSGEGNDGRIFGATWAKGKSGYALYFDGKTDYVDCGNKESLNAIGSSDFTLGAWVYGSSSQTVQGGIIWKDDYPHGRIDLRLSRTHLYTELYDSTPKGSDLDYHPVLLNDEQWHHVAVVVNKGVEIRLYFDGEEVNTLSDSRGSFANNKNLWI